MNEHVQRMRELCESKAVVQFTGEVEELEAYAQEGMMARLTKFTVIDERPNPRDCVYRIDVDYSEFNAHNLGLEDSNYYNREGKACLTAREAGYYKAQDFLFVGPDGILCFAAVTTNEEETLLRQAFYARDDKNET
jgi:hypothetical protein